MFIISILGMLNVFCFRKKVNMQMIEIFLDNDIYQIEWALSEYFDELKGKKCFGIYEDNDKDYLKRILKTIEI